MLDDTALTEEISAEVSELTSYGYRRVWGLLRHRRKRQSLASINLKWAYRVMRDHRLLLERRIKQPDVAHRHEDRFTLRRDASR